MNRERKKQWVHEVDEKGDHITVVICINLCEKRIDSTKHSRSDHERGMEFLKFSSLYAEKATKTNWQNKLHWRKKTRSATGWTTGALWTIKHLSDGRKKGEMKQGYILEWGTEEEKRTKLDPHSALLLNDVAVFKSFCSTSSCSSWAKSTSSRWTGRLKAQTWTKVLY